MLLKEAIGTGETIVEAQEDACRQLGVETHEANFDVLQMPEKKKFGIFGGSPAKVRAFLEVSPAQSAADYLKRILTCMGFNDVTMEIQEIEGGAKINLSSEDISLIIGKRGETLDALQYLTGLVANHIDNAYYRITIDTGNYREKREKTLEILGRRMAFKAIKTGKNVPLEPMNPYERRIIHTAVQKVNGAISWSEGENIDRHVVIGLDPNAKPYRRRNGGYNNRSRGGQKSVITTDITEAVIVIPIRPDMHRTTRYKKERQLTTAGIFPFTERSRQKKKKNLYKLFGGCTMQPPKK